jgi:hypothetical protein
LRLEIDEKTKAWEPQESALLGMVQTLVAGSLSICGPQRCKKVEKWQKSGKY